MNPNVKEITDKDFIIKAKKIGIKKPSTMSTKKPLNMLNRHEKKRRSHKIYRKFSRLAQKTSMKDRIPQKVTYVKQKRCIINR